MPVVLLPDRTSVSLRVLLQAANPFDVDECVGEFTGRHTDFLNAFSRTQMFAVYAEQHVSESEPEPESELGAMTGAGALAEDPASSVATAALGQSSSSDDGDDKL